LGPGLVTSAWNRAWGESWGLSWGLTYEANQEELYGRATNPNLKLQRIAEAYVHGTGARLTLRQASGQVTAVAEEERAGVLHLGTGTKLYLVPSYGGVRAEQHATVSGRGRALRLRLVGGNAATGAGVCAEGAKLSLFTEGGVVSAGASASVAGATLDLRTGELDDVYAGGNPSDEELVLAAYYLYKMVA